VQQALSIQAHPNKKLAEELHRTCPGHYPDANHKPEICIPLGHFEALCGFRPTADVRRHVCEVPELKRLVQLDEEEIATASLKDMFSRLMKSDVVQQANQVVALVKRLKDIADPDRDQKLILRISQDYPMDIGIFSVYFLNYVVITEDMPNRFIYCAPDEPHAYLCGDAVECMAMSDNVVRAGLTQKFKDVDTLLRMMTWRDDLLDDLVNVGERIKPHVVKYDPPVEDFMVYEVDGPVPEGIVFNRAAIVACISGSFVVDFRNPVPKDGDTEGNSAEIFAGADAPFSWRGEKRIIKGNTFFSRAGTELIVKNAREGSKLFIATY
jgi:mannose-6-phosphate isomerase